MNAMSYFKPDFLFEHFSNITPKWLNENNITSIFSDLDSTLAAHNQNGDKSVINWINRLKKENIQLIIISNNSQERVDAFTKNINIAGYGRMNKPSTRKIIKIMEKHKIDPNKSIFLGDQIFTDVLCGKRLGMKTVLVKPVEPEHEPWNITLKRKLETIIRSRW